MERSAGCFEQAQNGTLLLDEIGEMPLGTQAKLLRVIEESKVRRLGGTFDIPVSVRVLAATNRAPDKAIQNRQLREDLYYRLNVFHISLPPLRERKQDIPSIAAALIRDLNREAWLPGDPSQSRSARTGSKPAPGPAMCANSETCSSAR